MNIDPLNDRVLVKPLEAEEKTPGGIVLPDAAKEKPQQGEVLAVGPGRVLDSGERTPVPVKKGDIVVFPKFGMDTVTIDNVEHRIVNGGDILAIIE